MKKKIISILVVLGIIIGIIFSVSLYAGTGKLYTNLSTQDSNGVGYSIGNPQNNGEYSILWSMSTYNSTSGGLSDEQKNIYCLRAEYGASWEDFYGTSPILEYNMVFDLQNDREELLNKIIDNSNDADEVIKNLLDPTGTQYRQLLWLFDNAYVRGQTDIDEFLAQTGIFSYEYGGETYYYKLEDNLRVDYSDGDPLTEADIIAIQRAAIWCITNGESYDKTGEDRWLYITTDGTNYTQLNSISESRNEMAVDVYRYLINGAQNGASLYTAENNYTITDAPVEVNVDGLTEENGKYKMVAGISDSNYIIGPIVIEENNNFYYEISMVVTDENGTEIDSSKYSFTDANGTSLGSVSLKDLIGEEEGFYIKVAQSLATNVNIQIQVFHYSTTKNLWLQGTEDTDTEQIKLNAEQPVGEFSRETTTTTFEFVAEPGLTEVSVEKVWEDNDNQDGIRPTSIGVNLKNGDTTVETIELSESNNWTHTFKNLSQNENGSEINYTVEEITVTGYESKITGTMNDGYVITNTHTPEVRNITVTKVWEDENNQDGIRPNEISVNLKNGNTTVETIKLNESNNWTHTFENLPKNQKGNEINYTVEEITVTDYESKITGTMKDGFTITNTHIVGLTNITVTKIWDDEENQDGIRPSAVSIELLANGEKVEGKTLELNDENKWKGTFSDLPTYSSGNKIDYTVVETTLPEGYETPVITGNAETGYVITNTHIPEVTSVGISKIWDDEDNQDGIRPSAVSIDLLANGTAIQGKTVELNDDNEWNGTFSNLPVYSSGSKIEYTVAETTLSEGYTANITGDAKTGYIITNTHIPEKMGVPITKRWVDNSNQDGLRPTSISVSLLANGTEVKNETLTGEGDEWTYTFAEMPKYKDGELIQYTVVENNISEGYTSLTTGSMTNGFTITNTYSTGTTSVKVKKVWDDNDDQDGLRTNSVTVSLLGNGETIQTTELNDSNNWQYIFANLPEKSNGQDIIYTIDEITKIDGYTTTIKNNNVTSEENETTSAPEYIITNTHETDEMSITVEKVWDDENDYDKIRPESVTVNIKNGKTIVNTVTLSKDNNWTYTFEDLPVKENGETINYVIEEIEPDGYTADITEDENEENKYIITNTHVPEKTFDLALRKYITKINNNELTTLGLASRVPNISESTLKNGTTATYKHRKDPIEVEENDIITYAITIYNEGEKAGYASQIIDQLPEGLIYSPSTTVISNKNTYTVTYESSTNKVIFNIVNTAENPAKELQPYQEGNLDSETIEIKCKVIHRAKAGTNNILTNVAWINEAYDAEDNQIITTTIGDDRDSEPGTKPSVNKDNMEDYKGNSSNKDNLSDSTYYYEGEQDDDDFEKVYVKIFDLSLRKFVASVNGEKLAEAREPIVDVTPLQNGKTTAIYNHSKTPVALKVGDTVVYTIRIYNEGEINGYASEVKDYLPPYLEYVENSTINRKYGWNISEDGRLATTTYLSDREIDAFNGSALDYEDIQIECKISNDAIPYERITNIAEISEYKYGDTIYPEDVDSKSDNIDEQLPQDEQLPDYKKDQENDEYVPGNEDDDDFEKVYVKEFDLALRKFITQVRDEEITTREPQVKIENETISYEHTKDPLTVHVGDVVVYTIRVYNEGEIPGYASEITDDIPEYLEYLPEDSTNVKYLWKMYDENGNQTENVEEAVKVKTRYLSEENGENNLLEAFDGNTLYYRDIKIAFKVKDPNSNNHIITNCAQISDDTDEVGNKINDKDSVTDEWIDEEDDQDIENIKVEYFDLSILKFVSKVIIQENGTEKITETGYNGHENPEPVVKVELHKKKLNEVVVKFGYGITVTNEGDIPGYATEITDYVPEGLKFETADNPEWTDEGNNVISTKQLQNTLLQPGESKTIEVILTWINDPDNMAQKTNTVEISEDRNEYNVADRDSITDNKQDGEDDIDIAKVILAISTGNTQTYFMLTLGLLAVIAIGVALIKKFVI